MCRTLVADFKDPRSLREVARVKWYVPLPFILKLGVCTPGLDSQPLTYCRHSQNSLQHVTRFFTYVSCSLSIHIYIYFFMENYLPIYIFVYSYICIYTEIFIQDTKSVNLRSKKKNNILEYLEHQRTHVVRWDDNLRNLFDSSTLCQASHEEIAKIIYIYIYIYICVYTNVYSHFLFSV